MTLIFLHQGRTGPFRCSSTQAPSKAILECKDGDPTKGEPAPLRRSWFKNMVLVGKQRRRSSLSRLSPRPMTLKTRKTGLGGLGRPEPDSDTIGGLRRRPSLGKPIGKIRLEDVAGANGKIGQAAEPGLDLLRPTTHLVYYGSANPGAWNPVAAAEATTNGR